MFELKNFTTVLVWDEIDFPFDFCWLFGVRENKTKNKNKYK